MEGRFSLGIATAWLLLGSGRGTQRRTQFGCGISMIVLTLPGFVGQWYTDFGRGPLWKL